MPGCRPAGERLRQHRRSGRQQRRARSAGGLVEPIDPVAGHLPGDVNRFNARNLGSDRLYKPAAALREEFETLLTGRDPKTVVHQCGL